MKIFFILSNTINLEVPVHPYTMIHVKNIAYYIVESLLLSLFDNKLFIKAKKAQPSLLSLNTVWFTNCSWVEQMQAFKQLDLHHCRS